jgi:hypothetical protein
MEKRFQVFISSTYEDLQEERKEVMQALLELDCIPAGMELFPASNDDQWSLIRKVIDDSDYYLLILAGRYGCVNSEGLGYTEMEYRYALQVNKPIISFLHKNPEDIKLSKTEKTQEGKEKLESFRKLTQSKMIKYWTSPSDLGSVVSRSMVRLIKDFPATGWVKADDNIISENTLKEIIALQNENKNLKKLLEDLRTKAPDGTEMLSQGDDEIQVTFVMHCLNENDKSIIDECDYTFTWNQLFSLVAPYLINECSEEILLKTLNKFVEERFEDDIAEFMRNWYIKSIVKATVKESNFQILKVQLQALGLIQKGVKNRSLKDTFNYWKLTSYGEHIMNQLVAIKRK